MWPPVITTYSKLINRWSELLLGSSREHLPMPRDSGEVPSLETGWECKRSLWRPHFLADSKNCSLTTGSGWGGEEVGFAQGEDCGQGGEGGHTDSRVVQVVDTYNQLDRLSDHADMQTRRHTDILQTETLGLALRRNYAPTLIIIGQ